MNLPDGKLPAGMLRAFLASFPAPHESVLVGGAVGEDAAVIDLGGPELLVATTDPITFAGADVGRYLLAVNGNDLATTGALPRWLLATVLLPSGVSPREAAPVLESLRAACSQARVDLVGGHTEVTPGVARTIVVGCLLGTVARDRLISTAGARVGDALLLTAGVAIEGTAILATEHAPALRAAGLAAADIERAAGWLDQPGISVLPAARALHSTGAVHALHDPTEGGLATALHELAEAAGVGLEVRRDAVPVLPECERICAALGLDPLGLLASGALLAALDPAEAPSALQRLDQAGIAAAVIGRIVPRRQDLTALERGGRAPLPVFDRDELARFLETRG